MNLLTLLFRLPLMPLRGFVQLGEILHEQAVFTGRSFTEPEQRSSRVASIASNN